jgi:hypothetical protein
MNQKLYLTEKDAAQRYSLSPHWFQRMRWSGGGPEYIKVNGNGKILYPVVSTDAWFEGFSLKQSTSMSANIEKEVVGGEYGNER